MHFAELGKFLLIAGSIMLMLGAMFLLADKLPIGRLPGDFTFGSTGFKFHIPVATCIIVSLLLTLIFNFLSGK